MLDDKSLFDLPIEFEKCSFKEADFAYTNTYIEKHHFRKVDLYSNTNVRVLRFEYSRNGYGRTFVRFRDRGHRGYSPDVYYELVDGGKNSGGGKYAFGLMNPWEKYLNNWKLFTQQECGFLYGHGNDFEFLEKISDEKAIAKELGVNYIRLPIDVREIAYLCEIKESGIILLGDYSVYRNDYQNYRFRMIYLDNSVELFEVIKFGRYRDGGTTEVTLKDSKGVEHEFYYPNRIGLPDEEQIPTWDGKPMTRGINPNLKDSVVDLLGIILDPRKKD